MAILLKNATYIDWRTLEFTETDILVEEGLKMHKEELLNLIRQCPHYPCLTFSSACGYYYTEKCPFLWAFKKGVVSPEDVTED